MIEELVVQEIKRLLCEMRDLAVKAERERCAASVTAVIAATTHPECVHCVALRNCRDAIAGSEPEPSLPEPMTIATMIAKLSAVSNQNWHTIREDLEELVKGQARKDARIVATQGWNDGHTSAKAILKSAGLG